MVLVVAFHSGIGKSSGAFIGVDVFFVLSGYLVTHVLLRDLGSYGHTAGVSRPCLSSTDRPALGAFVSVCPRPGRHHRWNGCVLRTESTEKRAIPAGRQRGSERPCVRRTGRVSSD